MRNQNFSRTLPSVERFNLQQKSKMVHDFTSASIFLVLLAIFAHAACQNYMNYNHEILPTFNYFGYVEL